MVMAVVYSNFGGMLVHENRGGVERDYMPDPLGSTAALLDSNQTMTDTWEYWPYGEVASRTGTNPTPFTFVGVLGYFKDILDKLLYVRARHYQPNYTRWVTVDKIWPTFQAYGYVRQIPTMLKDPSGKSPMRRPPSPLEALCAFLKNGIPGDKLEAINRCIRASVRSGRSCPSLSDPIGPGQSMTIAGCLSAYCSTPGSIVLTYNDPDICCKENAPPARSWKKQGEPCRIVICLNVLPQEGARDLGGDPSIPAFWFNLLHEMTHCCGVQHGPGQNWEECNDIMACCIFNVLFGKSGSEDKCKRHVP